MAAPQRLTITIPDTPQLQDARRRFDGVRNGTGRVLTLAGAAAAGIVLVSPETAGLALMATTVTTGAGLLTLRFGQPDGHQRATTTVMYLMPGVSLVCLLAAERIVAGIHWGEVMALAAWTAATWWIRPARIARRMISPVPPAPHAAATAPALVEEVFADPIAGWWATRVATIGGAAVGTRLEEITPTGPGTLTAVIRATVAGEAVPEIPIRKLSALMDLPEEQIAIKPVPGRGAGVRLLTISPPASAQTDPREIWIQQIAPKAMPGSIITEINVGRPAHAIISNQEEL